MSRFRPFYSILILPQVEAISSHDTPKRRGVGTDALDFGCKLPYLAGLLPGAGYVEPGSTAGLVVDVRTRQKAECRW